MFSSGDESNLGQVMRSLLFISKIIFLYSFYCSVAVAQDIESFPLAPFSKGEEGAPLFVELDADEIGVGGYVNDYSSPMVWGERWREYNIGTIGTGIALGDIDGDGFPDLFISSKDEASKLYKNLGGIKFLDITEVSGFVDMEDPGSGCGFVDVDNDGDLDLYVCYVDGRNQLWINDGSGHFVEEAEKWGVAIKSGGTMASFEDFDRDGDMDFYMQNNMVHFGDNWEVQSDQLFENIGGRFIEITESAGIDGTGNGHSAVWWDYNEDGWPDVYVAYDYGTLDNLYRNNGDGTFTDVMSDIIPQSAYFSMGSDFGDINNDGHSDYWVADMAATSREWHLRTVGNSSHIFKESAGKKTHQYLRNAFLLKLDNEHFAEVAFLAGLVRTDWTWAPRLIDLNNDGRLDAFASNGMVRSFHDSDIKMKRSMFKTGGSIPAVFRNEYVLNERNQVFENLGDLRFENRQKEWGLNKLGVTFGVAFGDLDNDGDLDLVMNNYQQKLSVIRNDEQKGNRITVSLKGTKSNRYGVGSKLTLITGDHLQVKELALFRGYMSTDEPILHFGLGDYETIDRMEILWPSGDRQVFEGLEANRHYVISEAGAAVSVVGKSPAAPLFELMDVDFPEEAFRKEEYFSDFKEQRLLPFPESRLGGSLALGDLNNDGQLDMVISGSSGQETLSLLNLGDGQFEQDYSVDFEEDFGAEDWDLKLLDWDEDGDLDLLVASGGVELQIGDEFYADRLYLNDGEGDLVREWGVGFSEVYESTSVLAPYDFDSDGDIDLFSGVRTLPGKYPYSGPSSIWRNDEGNYEQVIYELGRVSAAEWADIDNDGDADLVIAREWAAPTILFNEEGALRQSDLDLPGLTGLWGCMKIADLNADGRLDIVVGNFGLNSEYEASEDEPMRLWYSDNKDGKVKLLESMFQDNQEWLRESRWRLEKEFPRELRHVKSFEDYASMTFLDIFPDMEAKGFAHKDITELQTGILWQGENGDFSFEALPSFAQSGRVMAILIEDFDRDGMKDILLSLEPISSETWSGRFEKGQLGLFLNKGNKQFETELSWGSGLVIYGSPRELAYDDLDGDGNKELIVFLNEGLPVVFKRR